MIFDHITNLDRYSIPCSNDVRDFLARHDLHELRLPEIELRGRELFVRLMRYTPKPAEQNQFETHQCYSDIQVVIKGHEIMQVVPSSELKPVTAYDALNDYQFFNADQGISSLIVPRDHFAVFFPGEAHRPSCRVADDEQDVFKLVFKVRMR